MWILLCTLRIDKLLTFGYNKARNQEVQQKLKRELTPLT